MELYSQSEILKRLESLKITNPAIFFDGMKPEEIEDKSNQLLLETVTKLAASELARSGLCNDTQLSYCFRLANKIINCITTKTLPNV